MKRIVVIGPPGAGKTGFAEELGRLLRIDVFHLDECAARERDLVARERWIIDGNYSATLDARLEAADTAVYLDLPTGLCLARFVRRRLAGGAAPVTWSALRGIVTFRLDHRPGFLALLAEHAERGLRVVLLRTPRDVRRFVADLRRQGETEGRSGSS